MIIYDKKKAVTAIMAKRHPEGGEESSAPMVPSDAKTEDSEPDGRHAAAQDIIAALSEKHPGKLMEALGNFHDLHSMMPKEEEQE